MVQAKNVSSEMKSALASVKVGDKVDIVWTEAVLVSLERGT